MLSWALPVRLYRHRRRRRRVREDPVLRFPGSAGHFRDHRRLAGPSAGLNYLQEEIAMRLLMMLFLSLLVSAGAVSCATMQGVGEDIESAVETIE